MSESELESESESDELEEEEEEDEESDEESEGDFSRVSSVVDLRSYSSKKRCRSVRESKKNVREYTSVMWPLL